ncbi:PREDICTED: phosphatidylinositol 3,4,5-trisphosphate 3-phosphatase and protein-tyrosine-phosphatase PTEN2A-like [Tarenaya hassleriana]|uniref:phosphatidylinositol 3,4,5-trisphosphate 3-phosphatase and protein-tyrosine-phosphatase PTEN2A-like n=1 Tax=Tarenaya hassleriana TaxID=28532 RepID=UPI00053C3A66|nr:PREDICTED: phosphatidylinositol 3,4,5-trisphosphate 3-phosphatase and protein-tyrosine-phosphatase PTEN2A-like [Tarenaya hassleriana]XP_010519294.1 PREDICTED: phosphatidylinositol 3,4,5-trisphosphate 3-phosphatase and protein-tyrosine-phosphatase PTEN2A-like [Tarenaya hassleriana]
MASGGAPDGQPPAAVEAGSNDSAKEATSKPSASGLSSWARNLKVPQPFSSMRNDSEVESMEKSTFARFTSGLGLRLSPKSQSDDSSDGASNAAQFGFIGTITKGLVDSSMSAVKAVQVKARHAVSQNKRRYQEGGFDLDLTYITENIIAMGFPAGDMSSGFFGYVEGLYRNHMEEVIKFLETRHQGKYKVYNLCSERLYDVSLFEGKVASFPFDDHNCPPVHLISSFCQSAYSWLKEDIENVVVVHCKAGMARTGLMISSLLLYLKFFPTAEECMDFYNQKRCVDGKGLVLPSQIRYVKYFERILTYFNGENQPGRRSMLRGFRLHRCPYWVRPSITVSDHNGVLFSTKKHTRTKDLSPEDFWFSAPKKGIMVFALPGEPGLTELAGDFKVHFHDRQGDFYCWLNTGMMENRKILNTDDLDGFDKRKLPSPGFQIEVVLADICSTSPATTPRSQTKTETPKETSSNCPPVENIEADPESKKETGNSNKDDVFSDSEHRKRHSGSCGPSETPPITQTTESKRSPDQVSKVTQAFENVSISGIPGNAEAAEKKTSSLDAANSESEFKVMAADASVFTFGDEEEYESE